MRTHPDCLPCFLTQAKLIAQRVSDDPDLIFRTVRYAATTAIPQAEMARTPAENATIVFRAAAGFVGVVDPYEAEKRRYNGLALGVYDALKDYCEHAPDPLEAALKVSALGNVLDLNILGDVDMAQVADQAQGVMWGLSHYERFQHDVAAAQRILILADNAGEIVFDRLLVEALPPGTVTYAVKSGPIANDVLLADAEQVGMHEVARVIETGSDQFGTPLAYCSPQFRAAFAAADVVISKGMANIETLSEVNANLYFILKVKCPVVAAHVGARHGDIVLLSQRERLG